jgi:hypothetical protein
MPDTCVGCGRDGGKDRGHSDGLYCDLCWHGEEGLEINRLRAENERLRERVGSLMLEEPSKSAGLYAAIDELQRENERLRGALTLANARGQATVHLLNHERNVRGAATETWERVEMPPASDEIQEEGTNG